MKKIISIILVTLLLLSCMIVSAFTVEAATTEKNVTIDKTGETVTLTAGFNISKVTIGNSHLISYDVNEKNNSKITIKAKAAGTSHVKVYNSSKNKCVDYKVTTKTVTAAKSSDKWYTESFKGVAVWPVKDIVLYSKVSTNKNDEATGLAGKKVGTLDAVAGSKQRKAVIVESNNGYIKVKGKQIVNGEAKEITGWQSASTNFLINMAEINTNIQYDITNAYKSRFMIGNDGKGSATDAVLSSGEKTSKGNKCQIKKYNSNQSQDTKYKTGSVNLSGITGKALYTYDTQGELNGKVKSDKLDKNAFVAPVLWKLAREIGFAECVAERNGYNLKIYDTYRPQNVCNKFWTAGQSAAKSGLGYYLVNCKVGSKQWGLGWFIANPANNNTSDHARGVAIDLTMVYKNTDKEIYTQSNIHDLSANSVNGVGSNWGKTLTDVLRTIMMTGNSKKSKLSDLSSEWWHFNLTDSSPTKYPALYYNVNY